MSGIRGEVASRLLRPGRAAMAQLMSAANVLSKGSDTGAPCMTKMLRA